MKNRKYFVIAALALISPLLMGSESGCASDADVASRYLSTASEQFEIVRKVTLYNALQDVGMISVEGRCSVEFMPNHSEVTCRNNEGEFVKHMMQNSHNTTMLVEQLASADVSTYQYRVLVKPSVIIPDFDIVVPGMEGNSRIGKDG